MTDMTADEKLRRATRRHLLSLAIMHGGGGLAGLGVFLYYWLTS